MSTAQSTTRSATTTRSAPTTRLARAEPSPLERRSLSPFDIVGAVDLVVDGAVDVSATIGVDLAGGEWDATATQPCRVILTTVALMSTAQSTTTSAPTTGTAASPPWRATPPLELGAARI
jgi:hypothetical protein